jgi:hypothetical protein
MPDLARLQPNWTIRPFRLGDAPAARRLIESVWHEHFHRHPDPFVRDFIYSRLSDVDNSETIYGDRAIFLCAIAESAIIGTGVTCSNLEEVGSRSVRLPWRFSAWRRYQVRRDISSLSQGFLASMVRARSSIRGRPFFRGFIGPCFPSPPFPSSC